MVLSSFPANLDWIHLCRYLICHALFLNLDLFVNDTPENVVRLKTQCVYASGTPEKNSTPEKAVRLKVTAC